MIPVKLAFSTLGCPNWTWDEIFATAKDMRIDGIEVRGVGREMYTPHNPLFSEQNAPAVRERLAASGLEISAFTSGAELGVPARRQQAMDEVRDYIAMAHRMGVPYVRVLISGQLQPDDADFNQAKALYAMLCEEAREKGVCLLMETNGIFCDTALLRRFMDGCDKQSAGVLWDLHHPYRFGGETPEQSFKNLGEWVRYVHVKDSVVKDGQLVYRMMGHGDLPVFDALRLLKQADYQGYITLEWVKRWNQELEEPGVVFYHYMTYMDYLMEQL